MRINPLPHLSMAVFQKPGRLERACRSARWHALQERAPQLLAGDRRRDANRVRRQGSAQHPPAMSKRTTAPLRNRVT